MAADKKDGLGYVEASPFDVGVRGGWRRSGPPHRERMLRLSAAEPGMHHPRRQRHVTASFRQPASSSAGTWPPDGVSHP